MPRAACIRMGFLHFAPPALPRTLGSRPDSSEFRLSITRMWSRLQTSFLQCAYRSRNLTSVRVRVQPAPSGDFAAMNSIHRSILARSLMASAASLAFMIVA